MSKRLRVGIIILLAGLALAAVGFYALTVLLRQTIAPLPAPTARPPLTQRVVAVTHDIPLGSILKSEDLRMLDMPIDLAPPGVIVQAEAAIGRITKVQLVAGELVMNHQLADPTNISHDLGFVLTDNQVLMAFPGADLMSSLSLLQRGDVIDILVTVRQTVPVFGENGEPVTTTDGEPITEEQIFTFNALQHMQITAMVVDVIREEEGATVNLPSADATPQPQPTPRPSNTKLNAPICWRFRRRMPWCSNTCSTRMPFSMSSCVHPLPPPASSLPR